MNKQQAKRIALALNGVSLIQGELPAICYEMTDADFKRVKEATDQMGRSMLERAGFSGDVPDLKEIFDTILGEHDILIESPSLDRFR